MRYTLKCPTCGKALGEIDAPEGTSPGSLDNDPRYHVAVCETCAPAPVGSLGNVIPTHGIVDSEVLVRGVDMASEIKFNGVLAAPVRPGKDGVFVRVPNTTTGPLTVGSDKWADFTVDGGG